MKPQRLVGTVIASALLVLFGATFQARGEIIAHLEVPDGVVSGISSLQGWAFTTTPGAKLVEPFEVRINNGGRTFTVPCCGERGDVRAAYPEAPLETGFSTAVNWGLFPGEIPLVPLPPSFLPTVVVEVVIRDDAGAEKILRRSVGTAVPGFWSFSTEMMWAVEEPESESPDPEEPAPILSTCTLSNRDQAVDGTTPAILRCTDAIFVSGEGEEEVCEEVVFLWRAEYQDFQMVQSCW